MEGKGLRVNFNKTKGMQLLFGKKSSVLKADLCCERFGCNSVQCTKCQRWVHRRWSDSTIMLRCLLSVEHVLVRIVQWRRS